jgi:hypothetical protein
MLRTALVVVLLGAPTVAVEDVSDAIKAMKAAVAADDLKAAKAAFAKAETFRVDAAKANRAASALARCIRAAAKKNTDIAIAGLQSFGRLRAPGSSRHLILLLRAPKKVPYDQVGFYLTAVRVAGELHEPATLPSLEKLLDHRFTDLAKAASESIVAYRALDENSRMKLIERLVRVLSGYEKQRARAKGYDARVHYDKMSGYLLDSLAKLSDHTAATTSDDWAAWIRSERKRARNRDRAATK